MRHIIFLLTATLFLVSCGQNDTKQKELELKERELALKEKEFALKQSDTTNNKTTLLTPASDNKNEASAKAETQKTKEELWGDFRTSFSNAIAQKNKKEVVRLSLKGDEFFDGGGGATAEQWVNSANNELWTYWQKALAKGVKTFEKKDKITKDDYMIFVFKNNNWYWYGVMGD